MFVSAVRNLVARTAKTRHISVAWLFRVGFLALFGAGITVIEVDEYWLAPIFWLLSAIVLTAILWPRPQRQWASALQILSCVGGLFFLLVMTIWTVARKGDEPWSNFFKLASTPTAPSPTPKGPRLGTGPDAYKDLTDEQVGQWAIEEADKIEKLATRAMDSYRGMSPRVQVWRFTQEFNDCCAQDVKDLRSELFRRLGPPAKEPDEALAWTVLFLETKYPVIKQIQPNRGISPMVVKHYAPYLRRLGLQLKRRAIPRPEPRQLHFSQAVLRATPDPNPNISEMLDIVVTIHTKEPIESAYIAVEFKGQLVRASTDLVDSTFALPNEPIANREFMEYMKGRMGKSYALRIGKTPITFQRPMRVFASGYNGFRASRATLFEE